MAFYKRWIAALTLALAWAIVPSAAQDAGSGESLRVATRVLPPMVVQDKGELGGFSIELWREIAARLKVQSMISVAPDVRSLLAMIKDGKAEVGIAAISVTAEREKEFDFSIPMLDSGLQILVRGESSTGPSNPLVGLWRLISSPQILVWLGVGLLFVLIPAHILFYLERNDDAQSLIPTRDYNPGIFHALWWTSSCLLTQAGGMPQHWLSRLMALLWMFFAIVFTALYTAELTADLTVQRIQSEIGGAEDLPGKSVATTKGSTASAYLTQAKADVTEVAAINEAFDLLRASKVQAVVFDAPILRHYAAHEGKDVVQVVGSLFREEDYGIAFPRESPWRKRVNGALLSMREDGTYQRIYDKWFAAD